jgi:hypothetical protein
MPPSLPRAPGTLVNLRPAFVPAAFCPASVLVPEALLSRHLAVGAAGSAFAMPTGRDVQPA